MISIAVLDAFGAEAVGACEGLKEYILISSEAEMKDLIDGVKTWPLLVCVYPSADGDDQGEDNYADRNVGLFYVVKPMREKLTRTGRTDLWKETQAAMLEFVQFIRDTMADQEPEPGHDFYEMLADCDFGKRTIDPEYNLLGCSGWSLMFNYTI